MGQDVNPLGGILGAALGESSEDAKVRIEEATKTANDLTGLVRKNKSAAAPAEAAPTEANGKRKVEDEADAGDEPVKKAKVETGET